MVPDLGKPIKKTGSMFSSKFSLTGDSWFSKFLKKFNLVETFSLYLFLSNLFLKVFSVILFDIE